MVDRIIEKLKIRDVAQCILTNDDGYAGLGPAFRINAAKALYAGDILDDIRSVLKVYAADRTWALKISGIPRGPGCRGARHPRTSPR